MRFISPPNIKQLLSGFFLACGFLAAPLQSALVVEWSGDYVSSYTGLTVGAPSTGSGWLTYNYSDTDPVSPAGPTFYGAFSLINGSGMGTPSFIADRFGIAQASPNDSLRFGATGNSGSITMRGLVFFQKEDFLNGGSGGIINFSEGGSLSLTMGTSIGSTRQVKMAVYALVDGEWNWYLSSSTAASGTLSITDPATANWGLYTIDASTAPLNAAPAINAYNLSGSLFEDIGAFGFYFNYVQNQDGNVSLFLSSFAVDATITPIPEPGSFSLLLGGITLVALSRAWKKLQK